MERRNVVTVDGVGGERLAGGVTSGVTGVALVVLGADKVGDTRGGVAAGAMVVDGTSAMGDSSSG